MVEMVKSEKEKEDDLESQTNIIIFFVIFTICFIVFMLYLYGYIFKPRTLITKRKQKKELDFGNDFSLIVLNVLNTKKEVYYLTMYKGFFEEVVKSKKTFSDFFKDKSNIEKYITNSDKKMPSFGNFGDTSINFNNFLHLLSRSSNSLNKKIISLSKKVIINQHNFPIQYEFLGYNAEKERYGIYTYQTLNSDTLTPTVSIQFENDTPLSFQVDLKQTTPTKTIKLDKLFGTKSIINDENFSIINDEEEELLEKVMMINPSDIFKLTYNNPTTPPPTSPPTIPPSPTYPMYSKQSLYDSSPVSNDYMNRSVKIVDTSSTTINNNQIGDNTTQFRNRFGNNFVPYQYTPEPQQGGSNQLSYQLTPNQLPNQTPNQLPNQIPETYLRQPSMPNNNKINTMLSYW